MMTRLKSAACCFIFLLSLPTLGATLTVGSGGFKAISQAMAKAKKGDTILVDKGDYRGDVAVNPFVTLISKTRYGAHIIAKGADKAVALTSNCTIKGFKISRGTIGVYSAGQGNTISECIVSGNTQTGIMCVGHLPKIIDNIIVYNKGSGIQGWDVRSTIYAISHNTIAFNANHGISLGGNSSLILENNIIAFNEKMGLKAEPQVKVTMKHNCFFGNTEIFESFPSENFSFDPLFVAPRKMNFALSKDSRCHNMGTDNQDIGVRFND
jgi:hypothetical protein